MVSFNNLTSAFDQKEIKNTHQGQNSLESCTVYKRSRNRMEKAHSTYMIFWNLHFSRYWVILQGLQNLVRMGMSWWTWRAGRGMGTEPWERAGPQPFAAISVEQGLRWRWQSRTRGSALQVWALQAMKHPCSPPHPKKRNCIFLNWLYQITAAPSSLETYGTMCCFGLRHWEDSRLTGDHHQE